MMGDVRIGLLCSVALHAAALVGIPMTQPVTFDVERAATSLELYLLEAPASMTQLAFEREPETSEVEDSPELEQPDEQTVVTERLQGAIAEWLPQYLRNDPPVYPRVARRRGDEGTVIIEAEVLPSGRSGKVSVLRSSGSVALDRAAVRAVRSWIFQPAIRWSMPMAIWVEIPITFRLEER